MVDRQRAYQLKQSWLDGPQDRPQHDHHGSLWTPRRCCPSLQNPHRVDRQPSSTFSSTPFRTSSSSSPPGGEDPPRFLSSSLDLLPFFSRCLFQTTLSPPPFVFLTLSQPSSFLYQISPRFHRHRRVPPFHRHWLHRLHALTFFQRKGHIVL